MKIYIDLLFLLNCWIDFFLLILVKLTLKRNCKLKRLFLASLVGSITTFCIFINTNYLLLAFIKITLTIIIVIIAFGYNDIIFTLKNSSYLFMMGIIFGGVASFLKNNVNNNISYLIGLIIITPLIVLMFYIQNKKIKSKYSLYYNVLILFDNNHQYNLCGYLDSGNRLRDPVTKKYIIIVNKNMVKGINKIRSPMYVPIRTVNKSDIIPCYKPVKLLINNKEFNNYLIGVINKKINIDGVDCLLNNRLLEDL